MKQTIEQTLQKPEGKQLKFKRDLSLSWPIMKSLIIFDNTADGTLLTQSKTHLACQLKFILSTIGSSHAITHKY